MPKLKDVIHGDIILDDIATKIVATKWFERLENIMQLGFVYKVCEKFGYDRIENHNRYYHSIGTYYLAGVFLDNLEKNSNKKIDKFYKLCVKLAGLLHDIAHGPFSHFWEDNFNKNYKHEDSSEIIIDDIFDQIELPENLKEGITLIKSLIRGEENPKQKFPEVPEYIFEIISNKRNGIDVDKWDYIQRDYHYCKKFLLRKGIVNIKANLENIDNLFKGAKISENSEHIDFGSCEKINNLFKTRLLFHKNIYRLPEVALLDKAVAHILEFANKEKYNGDLKCITPNSKDNFLKLNDIFINDIIEPLNKEETLPPRIKRYLNYYLNLNFEKICNEEKQKADDYILIKLENTYYEYYFREINN